MNRPLRRRALAPVLLLALLVAGLAARTASAQTITDPSLFAKSLEAAKETLQEYGRFEDPVQLARVNRIGYELAQHSEYQKYPFTFEIVDMPVPNALSLPGGQIFITRGMLDVGLDDDMLACVLGHEIGHTIREHVLHMQRRITLMNILGNALVLGAIAGERGSYASHKGVEAPYDPRIDYSNHGNMVQGAAATSLVLSELLLRSFSRDNEDEADFEGQRLAAAAGYDPDGARRVWELMNRRAPQIKEYGYLQTHPFADERIKSAEARKGTWKIEPRLSADEYRQRTQEVLVSYLPRVKEKPEPRRSSVPGSPEDLAGRIAPKHAETVTEFLKTSALATWPRGPIADTIRLERLHRLRDAELAKAREVRDYGRVLAAYNKQLAELRALARGTQGAAASPVPGPLTPPPASAQPAAVRLARLEPGTPAASPAVGRSGRFELLKGDLLPKLESEMADLDASRKALYPRAVEVLRGGVYETPFLVAFLSNFPDSGEVPHVALALGDAWSRIGRESDAVAQYLTAWKAAPESADGRRARAGLKVLAPNVKELAALQQLADQEQDPELRRLASERLSAIARTYDDLGNGADYLRRFPEGEQVVAVLERLNVLADNLYGEVVLYQGFGDSAKAIERINKILANAPLSPAADRLRDRAMPAAG